MKKKILSSFLLASMIMTFVASNAFAALTQHTYSLSASTDTITEDVETVVVTVTIDSTYQLGSLDYTLTYPTNVFEVDNTDPGSMGYENVPEFVDQIWYDEDFTSERLHKTYLKNAMWNGKNAGTIALTMYGTSGVTEAHNQDDAIISKLNLKVKDDAPAGTYSIAISGKTSDNGDNSDTTALGDTISITVEGSTPTSVLEDVAGLTGELAQYNGAKMFRANATNLTVDADDKLVITSVDTEESKTMSRTLWKALDLEGNAPVDISSLTVVVMVTADADDYANGFTFSLE